MSRVGNGNAANYAPLDELLENKRVLLLRRLRRFDWVIADDLSIAMDIEKSEAVNKALSRLVQDGLVDRRGPCTNLFEYRINKRGLAELDRVLAKATLPERRWCAS